MGKTFSVTAELTDASAYLDDPEQLRRRAQEDGYLFIRGLLPAEDVLQVRALLLAVMQHHQLRRSSQQPLDGTLDLAALNRIEEEQMRLDIGVPQSLYQEVQKLWAVHHLPHHPRLKAVYEAICGPEVLVHPRHIVRMVTPHHAMAPTPAHQDFPHIQGSVNTWTCWFPIGDCPKALGGLAVLRASHRLGCLPVQPARGAGAIEVQLCPQENEWLTTDYRVGDVLTFPSYTVHKALPCQMADQVRLSFDIRYQAAAEPVEEKSLLPHCDLSWQEIYHGWAGDDDLRYYWRRRTLAMSPWDETLRQPGRRIC